MAQPTSHAEHREQPPLTEPVVDDGHRDAEREAEDEAEGHHQVELALAEVAEDPHHEGRVLLEVVDHHDLRIEELVDVLTDLVGHGAYDARHLRLHAGDHDLPRTRRQVAPQRRVLAPHDLLDHGRHLRLEDLHDVLGDLVGLELLVELLRRTELGDRLVHGDAAHLRCPRGHDALPADAALQDPGHLLELAGKHPRELPHPGDLDAVEADRGEQHDQAGPVDQPADDTGEDRDGEEVEPVDVLEEPVDLQRHHSLISGRAADRR